MRLKVVAEAFIAELRRVKNFAVEVYDFLEHLDRMAMHGLAILLKGPGPY